MKTEHKLSEINLEKSYNDMSVFELRQKAKSLGMINAHKYNKYNLIQYILEKNKQL